MTNVEQQFCEGIGSVAITNGVARMFLVSAELNDISSGKQPGEIRSKTTGCVTMPMNGFLVSVTVIEKFLRDPRIQRIVETVIEQGQVPDGLDLSLLRRTPTDVPMAVDGPKANGAQTPETLDA